MNRKTHADLFRLALVVMFLLLAAAPTLAPIKPALAQGGDQYELSWFTVGGGGEMSSQDGTFALGATAGEPATGRVSNGEYSIEGGFWVSIGDYKLFLPFVRK